MNLEQMIPIVRRYATAREGVADIIDTIKRQQEGVLSDYLPSLRTAVRKTNTLRDELTAAIADSPGEFSKPRTQTVDGVRFGLTTVKGGIDYGDAEALVEVIKDKLPRLAESLIAKKESPNKKAIAMLTDEDLLRIGLVRSPDDPNAVFIKATDDEVDKLVATLLDENGPAGKSLEAA